mmetsp:Transcript_23055/g.33011  ORF Transcript_23055/g.33011 Transcript_23055/m.33011 type:complete len:131 (+) Transcript_23055:487-879(+)
MHNDLSFLVQQRNDILSLSYVQARIYALSQYNQHDQNLDILREASAAFAPLFRLPDRPLLQIPLQQHSSSGVPPLLQPRTGTNPRLNSNISSRSHIQRYTSSHNSENATPRSQLPPDTTASGDDNEDSKD